MRAHEHCVCVCVSPLYTSVSVHSSFNQSVSRSVIRSNGLFRFFFLSLFTRNSFTNCDVKHATNLFHVKWTEKWCRRAIAVIVAVASQLTILAGGCCFWQKHVKLFVQHTALRVKYISHLLKSYATFWHCCDFRRKSLNVNRRYMIKTNNHFVEILFQRCCWYIVQRDEILSSDKMVRNIFTDKLWCKLLNSKVIPQWSYERWM